MSSEWPEFATPSPIDGARSWTAKFDSYDQRNDDCYYAVSICDGDHETARFIARIDVSWSEDSGTALVTRLREEIHAAALRGHTNTDYRGRA